MTPEEDFFFGRPGESIDHVEEDDQGHGSVKMDAPSGSTYKSPGRFENIEIRAEL